MLITSLDNNTIKKIASLADKKKRDETGLYVVDGYRAVKDSLPYLDSPTLVFSEKGYATYGDELKTENDFLICSDKVFAKVSQTENAQGVIAVAKKKFSAKIFESPTALFLDRIRDPGNLGTIIRSALATGFTELYLYDCVDAYNPKVVRSAVSAVSRVNLIEADYSVIDELKERGYAFICADMGGVNVFEATLPDKLCLCIGNEANGLSDDARSKADVAISLPMESGESLNAGVCASIMMYVTKYGTK